MVSALMLVSIACVLALAPSASAAPTASTYPAAGVGYLSYRPSGIKFGSGSTFSVKRWKNWGSTKAVGTGFLCDHCSNKSYGIRVTGKIVLGSKKSCGVDQVYTTYRLSFKGKQKRKAGFWRKAKVTSKLAMLGCKPGGSNFGVHMPTNWDVLEDYPVASDFEPKPTPAQFFPTRRLFVESVGAWTGWGGPSATAVGTAKVYDYWPECADEGECARSVPVSATVSDLGHCGTYLTYRQTAVQPLIADPSFAGWSDNLFRWSVPCQD